MNIKRIELQGFKSFANRTKIVFHPGITTIIGPNGTGKSNIVDALLWVLGGKRFRSLRGERSGDIIFTGNAKKPALNMADVTLCVGDGEDDTIINHRAFRTGESDYRMDGKIVRLMDIQDTLRKKNIGETQYFVIEQGAVGTFLNSKPTEKRQLIEEAAGTAYYREKKRQTQNKLENTEQNLIRLEDIIDEVEKAKNSLKRKAQAAIRYRKIRERTRELTLFLFRRKIGQLEVNHQSASTVFRGNVEKEKDSSNRLKEQEKVLAMNRQEIWTLEQSVRGLQEKRYTQEKQLSHMESEIDKDLRRIEYFEEKKTSAKNNQEELLAEMEAQAKALNVGVES